MRYIFRADCGPTTGFGHFIRSVALAGYLRDSAPDADILFACRLDREMVELAAFQSSALLQINASFRRIEDDDDFLFLLQPVDRVVLDNYYFSAEYQREVRSRSHGLLTLHDMPGHEFCADVVVSGTPLPREAYNMPEETAYFSGLEYFPLRKEFFLPLTKGSDPDIDNIPSPVVSDAEMVCRKEKGECSPIVMAMGGADPLALAPRLLPALKLAFPDRKVVVIGGRGLLADPEQGLEVVGGLSAREMVTLFDNACFGLFPASTVCIEALSRRLPVVAGRFVDNQDRLLDALVEGGHARSVGDLASLASLRPEEAAVIIRRAGMAAMATPALGIPFHKGKTVLSDQLLTL